MDGTTPAPQVRPTLRSSDAPALIAFLVGAFGFEVTARYGEGDRVDHAELSWPPGGGIMLGSTRTDDADFAVRDPEGNRWSFGTYRGEPRKRA